MIRMIARTVIACVFTLLLLLPFDADAAQEGPHGVWNGAIEVPGQPLAITVTLRSDSDGVWSGTIDIPAQNLAGMPLSAITVSDNSVGFAMAGVPGDPVFTGTWDAAGEAIDGDFRQGGGSYPFHLARSGDAGPAAARTAVDADTAAAVTGTWSGTLAAGGAELRLIFRLAYADGALSGTMDSPDQGQTGLPLSEVAFDGNLLRLDMTYAGAYFEGELAEDGASIAGNWNQGGAAVPLTLQKQ
jgi:hypothetical protein